MRRWRRWGLVAALALDMYWPAAFVFLNTPLGEWVVNGGWSSHPRKVRMHWASGVSWWPGRFELQSVELQGKSRRTEWSLAAESAGGRIAFGQLFRRRVLLRHVKGRGATFALAQRPEEPAGEGARPRRWTVDLPEIELEGVRELAWGSWKLTGEGKAQGGFRSAMGVVSVEGASLAMSRASLEANGRELARDLSLASRVAVSPYVPRDFPGALGFDFLSGSVTGQGLGGTADDTFEVELQAREGRLEPGSRLSFRSNQGESRRTYEGAVIEAEGAPLLRLAVDGSQWVIGARANAPPLLTSRELRVTAESGETRLASLFGRAQQLRKGSDATPFEGELVAKDLRLQLIGETMNSELALDHATGRLDVGAFLHRELAIANLTAQGGEARATSHPEGLALPPAARPWAMRFARARLRGLESLSLDAYSLAGPADLATDFELSREGSLTVERLAVSLPRGRLTEAGATLARQVSLDLELGAEPVAVAQLDLGELLSGLNGHVQTKAEVSSLGFLRPWLGRNPWLGLAGQGRLAADLRVDQGLLVGGSHLEVVATQIEAQILGAVARGRGRIDAQARGASKASHLELRARLDRFTIDDEVQARLVEGNGLALVVSSAEALRLGAVPKDSRVTVDLERATLPNLAMFNPLLPSGAEVTLLPAVGTLGLHLELDGGTQRGHGRLTLDAESARVRIQQLMLGGRLRVEAPFATASLSERRFELAGTRLSFDPGTYLEIDDHPDEPAHPWWAQLELLRGELTMGQPVSFESSVKLEMKDSGPFLALFAQKRRYLKWFSQVLLVEGVYARAELSLDRSGLSVDPLEISSEKLVLVSRLRFSENVKQGDLFLSYGKLEVGVELRDGQRDLKVLNPRKWFETWHRPR